MPERREPRDLATAVEAAPVLPEGTDERYSGYGVMGLPFASGHILALRNFTAASVGEPYLAVWHRDPAGRWTIFQTVAPTLGCSRYFGSQAESVSAAIEVAWTGPRELTVVVDSLAHSLDWRVSLRSSPASRAMNAVGSAMPRAAWHNGVVLRAMGAMARPMLGVGRVRLTGDTANGQRYVTNPLRLWLVDDSEATLDGEALGPIGPAPAQGALGDFLIPQRGVFALGEAFFEPSVGEPATEPPQADGA